MRITFASVSFLHGSFAFAGPSVCALSSFYGKSRVYSWSVISLNCTLCPFKIKLAVPIGSGISGSETVCIPWCVQSNLNHLSLKESAVWASIWKMKARILRLLQVLS